MSEMLAKLGKHKTGKCCLYVKRLDELHLPTLKQMIRISIKQADKVCSSMQAHRSTRK